MPQCGDSPETHFPPKTLSPGSLRAIDLKNISSGTPSYYSSPCHWTHSQQFTTRVLKKMTFKWKIQVRWQSLDHAVPFLIDYTPRSPAKHLVIWHESKECQQTNKNQCSVVVYRDLNYHRFPVEQVSENSRPNNRVLLLSEMLRGHHKFFVNSSIFFSSKFCKVNFLFIATSWGRSSNLTLGFDAQWEAEE